MLQEGVIQNIHTVTERVDKMEASNLMGFTYQGLSHMEALVVQIFYLEKDMISYLLCIDGLDSRLNTGAD